MNAVLSTPPIQFGGQDLPPNRASQLSRPETSISGDKSTVLVVDDEHLIADTLVEILNDHGFEAIAAYDGLSALKHVRSFCPDTVITDVAMPGTNGIEVAKAIRKICPGTRVILFSGHAATADLLDRARHQGHSFELLAKPLDPVVLLKKLSEK